MSKKLILPLLGQPDPNAPKDIHLVGRYAVGVTWADDHGSIFPFDKLRHDCPCGGCVTLAMLTQSMAWPTEIKKLDGGLRVLWADSHESVYPYPQLRALCKCAACTGGH